MTDVTTWRNFDGQGAACLDDTGRVRLFVSGDVADLFDRANASGVSTDALVNLLINEAETHAKPAAISTGTDSRRAVPVLRQGERLPGPRRLRVGRRRLGPDARDRADVRLRPLRLSIEGRRQAAGGRHHGAACAERSRVVRVLRNRRLKGSV